MTIFDPAIQLREIERRHELLLKALRLIAEFGPTWKERLSAKIAHNAIVADARPE